MAGPANVYKGIIKRDNQGLTTDSPPRIVPASVGWSVVYYFATTTPLDAFTSLDGINTAEMALYPPTVHVHDMYVSDLGLKGDRQSGTISTYSGTFSSTDAGYVAAMADPTLAFPCRFRATTQYHITRWLRGLPDFYVFTDNRSAFQTTSQWITNFNAWTKAVQVDAVHVIVGVDPSGNPTYTTYQFDKVPTFAAGKMYNLSIRRAGRPFDLRVGRRRVA